MIVAEQKPLEEIKGLLAEAKRVLVVGCGTCVTVCFAGGEKEAGILATSLRMASKIDGQPKDVTHTTVQRQCEWEYIDSLGDQIREADIVLSVGCGVGVQALVERFPEAWVVPGLNTAFMGMPTEQGVWEERCAACGSCILGLTGGICPIARCAKQLLNGPCGGSQNGVCEISKDLPCAWQLIYDRLKSQNRLHLITQIQPPKDWSTSRDGGPRRITREDLRLAAEVSE
ncbi:MAG TPA: methylenetetrahydrofolate reductase C-terminal domain-containing protein [Anaerolineales bacterium]|nr:methylenetetrahydrofolate reductase C-terminal domain-containing protein [Anaerolineales bacterium]